MACTNDSWTWISQVHHWEQRTGAWSAETLTWAGTTTSWSVDRDVRWNGIIGSWGQHNEFWGDASTEASSWTRQSKTLLWSTATGEWGDITGTWKSKKTLWGTIDTSSDFCWDETQYTWDTTGNVF